MKKGLIALIYIVLIVLVAVLNKPREGVFTGTGGGGYITSSDGGGSGGGGSWSNSSGGGSGGGGSWSNSSGGGSGGGGPSGPASSRSKRTSERHKKIAGFNPTARSYQSEYRKNRSVARYKKWYIPGTYKTSVLVYGGDVFMTSYDTKGPQYDKGYGLITGQKHSIESTIQ